jgi:hypothetical protein
VSASPTRTPYRYDSQRFHRCTPAWKCTRRVDPCGVFFFLFERSSLNPKLNPHATGTLDGPIKRLGGIYMILGRNDMALALMEWYVATLYPTVTCYLRVPYALVTDQRRIGLNLRELGLTKVASCAASTLWMSGWLGFGRVGFLRIYREQPRCIRGPLGLNLRELGFET